MWLKLVSGTAVALLALASALSAAQCIEYLLNDEIRVQCEGKERVVLQRPGLTMYAIGAGRLAIITTRIVRQGNHGLELHGDEVRLIGGGQEKLVKLPAGGGFLYSSCGTILAKLRDARQTTWDVIAGQRVTFTALRHPVCSSDRSRIMGINSVGDLVTGSGTVLAKAGLFGEYAMSPSGTVIALFRQPPNDLLRLCVTSASQPKEECYSSEVVGSGGMSVDDDGRVLFVELIGETCYYRNGRLTPNKVPGALADQCFQVALAAPKASPRPIALCGYMPSWTSDTIF